MEKDSLKWLFDINQSIGEIDEFLAANGINSFSQYTKNKLLKSSMTQSYSQRDDYNSCEDSMWP